MSDGLVKAAMQLTGASSENSKLDLLIESTQKQTESLDKLIALLIQNKQ